MNTKNKIANNAIWIIGCRIAQSLFALIISMLTARYLGPSGFGIISYAASLVTFVTPIMTLGINHILVNELVKNPEQDGKILGTSLTLSCISSVFCIIGVTTFAAIANPNEKSTIIVCFLYSFLLLFQSLELLRYWFQAKYLSKFTSLTSLFAYAVVSLYKTLLLVFGKNIYWFAVSNAFDSLIIVVIIFIIYKRKGGRRFSFSFSLARHLLSQGKYYILSGLMVTIYAQTDKIMLKALCNEAEVGFYSAAITICTLSSFVFTAIIDSFRPAILENKGKNEEQYKKLVTMLYSVVIYASLAVIAITFIFADLIVGLIYGEAYSSSVGIIRTLIWYATFSFLGGAKSVWILAEGKQKYLVLMNLAGASANVILNLLLIPSMQGQGAAVASLTTQIFTNVGMFFIVPALRGNLPLLGRALDPRLILKYLKPIFNRICHKS